MRKKTDVFLLAENRLLREALLRLLSKKSEIRIVGANGYSSETPEQIIATRPQIVLIDSNGLVFCNSTLIPTLIAEIRNVRVVMVDMDSDGDTFLKAVRKGVVG